MRMQLQDSGFQFLLYGTRIFIKHDLIYCSYALQTWKHLSLYLFLSQTSLWSLLKSPVESFSDFFLNSLTSQIENHLFAKLHFHLSHQCILNHGQLPCHYSTLPELLEHSLSQRVERRAYTYQTVFLAGLKIGKCLFALSSFGNFPYIFYCA